MNRGSPLASRGPSCRAAGFNEAPIHESGKYASVDRLLRPLAGFNEAPIHESGKSRSFRSRNRTPPCFNEAPIHESGK